MGPYRDRRPTAGRRRGGGAIMAESRDQAAETPGRDSGLPGGGQGRVDDVGRTPVYPATGPYPSAEAEVRTPGSFVHGQLDEQGRPVEGGSRLTMTPARASCSAAPRPPPAARPRGRGRTPARGSTSSAPGTRRRAECKTGFPEAPDCPESERVRTPRARPRGTLSVDPACGDRAWTTSWHRRPQPPSGEVAGAGAFLGRRNWGKGLVTPRQPLRPAERLSPVLDDFSSGHLPARSRGDPAALLGSRPQADASPQ